MLETGLTYGQDGDCDGEEAVTGRGFWMLVVQLPEPRRGGFTLWQFAELDLA